MSDYTRIEGPFREDREGADWGTDPDSGARVIRLTSAAAWSHNIYCEQPYGSPDGRRFLVARAYDTFAPSRQLLVADLQTLRLTLVEPDLPTEFVAHSSWGEWVYYVMHDGSVRRLSLLSLAREAVCPPGTLKPAPAAYVESATPDGRFLIGYEKTAAAPLRSFVFDVKTGEKHTLRDGPDNTNPHEQADPGGARRLVYQLIRRSADGEGVPVFVQDLTGGATPVQLPFGAPWSAESSGHMAWVGTTGRVACAVNWLREPRRHDPRHPEGNLLVAAPGDSKPAVFPAPSCGFYHVSTSRCGRYFVADDFMDFRFDGITTGRPGPVRIVVGNLETGRSRALLRDCQAYGISGSSRYEPDPYFTADNGHVIYNASPFGINQVFAAEVPPAFLASLG